MKDFELKKIKEKCQLFYQFVVDRLGLPAEGLAETNRLLEKAYAEKNVKVLKAGDADVNESVRHLSLKNALEIKAILKEKLGIDFEVVDKLRLKTIEKLLKKGKINTPADYELLLNRVDEIYADPNKQDEWSRINVLLADYHKKQLKKDE